MLNLNLPNEFLYVGCVKLHPKKKKKEARHWLDHFYYQNDCKICNVVISYEIENKTEKKCKREKDCVTPQTRVVHEVPHQHPHMILSLSLCFSIVSSFSCSFPLLPHG